MYKRQGPGRRITGIFLALVVSESICAGNHRDGIDRTHVRCGTFVAVKGSVAEIAIFLRAAVGVVFAGTEVGTRLADPGLAFVSVGAGISIVTATRDGCRVAARGRVAVVLRTGIAIVAIEFESGLALAYIAYVVLGTCLLYTSPSPRD